MRAFPPIRYAPFITRNVPHQLERAHQIRGRSHRWTLAVTLYSVDMTWRTTEHDLTWKPWLMTRWHDAWRSMAWLDLTWWHDTQWRWRHSTEHEQPLTEHNTRLNWCSTEYNEGRGVAFNGAWFHTKCSMTLDDDMVLNGAGLISSCSTPPCHKVLYFRACSVPKYWYLEHPKWGKRWLDVSRNLACDSQITATCNGRN